MAEVLEALGNAARAAVEYARSLDWQRRVEQPRLRSENSADPAISLPQQLFEIGQGAKIFFGHVTDSMPAAHWYKVQPELGLPVIPCCMLSQGPLGFLGARKIDQLPPDTPVVFLWSQGSSYGRIIGAEPEARISQIDNFSDMISVSSRCGIRADNIHQIMLGLPRQGDITDWSCQRPLDALGGGESGVQAETGVGSFVDSEMAYQRANEDTGTWHFRSDDLTRVAGHNRQDRSAASETEELDDQGELTVTRGESPYFWERLGAWMYGQPVFQLTDLDAADPASGLAPVEPIYADQQPFDRVARHGGYLGQGGRRSVCLPPGPPTQDQTDLNRYSVDRLLPSVFSEQVALTGAYRLASSHSVVLSKRLVQPTPRQRMRPEDASGDTPDNYRAAGLLGDGPDHRVVDQPLPATEDESLETAAESATAADRHAYAYAWENLLPFRMHRQDWFTPDESTLGIVGGAQQEMVDFSRLVTDPYLASPSPVRVWVDHRYGTVKLYANSSMIELSPRGNVFVRNGFGASVDLVSGNVEVSCPGDFVVRPGRRFVVMAGKDVCVRAADSIDLSSTDGDVRVRAGGKLKLKGKGVELYSDADLTMRAIDGNTRIWTGNLYVQAFSTGEVTGSSIHFDAPNGTFTIHAKTMMRFLGIAAFDCFGGSSSLPAIGSFDCVSVYSAAGAQICGDMFVSGCLAADKNVYAGRWLIAANGHVATSQAGTPGHSQVSGLKGDGLIQVQNVILAGEEAQTAANDQGEAAFEDIYMSCLYATGGDGDTTLITDFVFRYRSVEDYGTSNYYLFESSWQQQARLQGNTAGLRVWREAAEDETYPFPGAENFTESAVYRLQDFAFYDVAAGRSRDTADALDELETGEEADAYLSPVLLEAGEAMLSEQYLIVDFTSEEL